VLNQTYVQLDVQLIWQVRQTCVNNNKRLKNITYKSNSINEQHLLKKKVKDLQAGSRLRQIRESVFCTAALRGFSSARVAVSQHVLQKVHSE